MLGAVLCCASLSHAQPITLFSGLVPPVSYLNPDDNQARGMAVDMMHEVIACTGDKAQISAHPWPRAVKLFDTTPYSGLFVADRTPEREHRYQWVGPIYRSTFGFYALSSADIRVRNFSELKNAGTVAVPRDWQVVERAKKEGLTNILEVSDTHQLLAMLRSERVSVIGIDELMLHSLSYKAEEIKRLIRYADVNGFLALSKDIPTAQVRRWQRCFDKLKQQGVYQRIYLHWVGQPAPTNDEQRFRSTSSSLAQPL